jgi:hypothetical protein
MGQVLDQPQDLLGDQLWSLIEVPVTARPAMPITSWHPGFTVTTV